jgi:hypothetical protein
MIVYTIKNDLGTLNLFSLDIGFFNFENLGWSKIINNTSVRYNIHHE